MHLSGPHDLPIFINLNDERFWKNHNRSDLVDHWKRRIQKEWVATVMDGTRQTVITGKDDDCAIYKGFIYIYVNNCMILSLRVPFDYMRVLAI